MNIGIIGLGRMGRAIAQRLLNAGIDVIGFDKDVQACAAFEQLGGKTVTSVAAIAKSVHTIWLMLPAGPIIDAVLDELIPVLSVNSIIIDGGNSKFTDSIIRAQRLESFGSWYLDCGTSGGLHGEQLGFSLMIGGSKIAYERVIDFFALIATSQGYAYVGPSGAGHYVKMVHNGIEYALLQSYAEGFHLLKDGYYKNLDLAQISNVWQHGSIVRSWILQLAYDVFARDQNFTNISGFIGGGQTGAWTVEEAHKQHIAVPLIERSLQLREESHKHDEQYAAKIVALLRHEFGGHAVKKKDF